MGAVWRSKGSGSEALPELPLACKVEDYMSLFQPLPRPGLVQRLRILRSRTASQAPPTVSEGGFCLGCASAPTATPGKAASCQPRLLREGTAGGCYWDHASRPSSASPNDGNAVPEPPVLPESDGWEARASPMEEALHSATQCSRLCQVSAGRCQAEFAWGRCLKTVQGSTSSRVCLKPNKY